MGEEPGLRAAVAGRAEELARLESAFRAACGGAGSALMVCGEPGIGKTVLVDAFLESAASGRARILRGSAVAGSAKPFQAFSEAVGGELGRPLFEEFEHAGFVKIFAVNRAGMLMAQASSGEGDMDADIFAGMLSAVQDFVRDSFGRDGGSGLGRLEYGDMTILMEHGRDLFLATVFTGCEHRDMRPFMKQALERIEAGNPGLASGWSGKASDAKPVQDEVAALAGAKFRLRKNLEGVKLEGERLRIADSVLECLARISAERPTVMVLEDLHWADSPSIFVLRHLARNIGRIPAVIIGTWRPGESAATDSEVEAMLADGTAAEIRLGRLDRHGVGEMLARLYPGNDFPRDFPDTLAERCGGNPLFVGELLKGMAADGCIAESGGRFSLLRNDYPVPDSLETMIGERLSKLSPEALAIAEYASCIGARFETAAALSLGTAGDTAAGWEELLGSGIVLGGDASHSFCHAVYQEIIYSSVSDRWKRAHHRSIGEWFEKEQAGNPDAAMYDLARHFRLAGGHAKAWEYCARAGEKAAASYAAEQALSYFGDALDSLGRARGTPDAGAKASDLRERVGDLRMLLSDFGPAIESFSQAAEGRADAEGLARLKRKAAEAQMKLGEFDRTLELVGEARALLGDSRHAELGKVLSCESYVHIARGELDRGLSTLNRALEIFREMGGTGSDVGNVLRGIGNIHWRRGDFGEAQRHYEMSLDAMERCRDLPGTIAALNNLGLVHADRGEPEAALEFYGKALGALERTGDRYMMTMVLNNMGLLYSDRGKMDIALDYYRRSLELRERIGDRVGVAAVCLNMGNTHINIGMPEKALELFRRCLRISEEAAEKKNMASALGAIGNAHSHLGDAEQALAYLERSRALCEEIGERYTLTHVLDNIGSQYLDTGDPQRALGYFKDSLRLREEMGDRNDLAWSHYQLALANLRLGNTALALEHAEKSQALAQEMSLGMEMGASLLVKALALAETGRQDEAAEMLEAAGKRLADGGHRSLHADALFEEGLLKGRMGRRDEAVETLAAALSEYEKMGKRLDAEKCRKALDEL